MQGFEAAGVGEVGSQEPRWLLIGAGNASSLLTAQREVVEGREQVLAGILDPWTRSARALLSSFSSLHAAPLALTHCRQSL